MRKRSWWVGACMCAIIPPVMTELAGQTSPKAVSAHKAWLRVQVLSDAGAVITLTNDLLQDVQCRAMPSAHVNPPLVVSVARGLVAVCAMQRITVFDMNDIEDEGGDSDEEAMSDAEQDT